MFQAHQETASVGSQCAAAADCCRGDYQQPETV